jgi:hypothetical protein
MKEGKKELFLQHLLQLIKERANELSPMSNALNDFEAGQAIAYHEVMDYVLECSRIFDLPLSELGIYDFNPDKLL